MKKKKQNIIDHQLKIKGQNLFFLLTLFFLDNNIFNQRYLFFNIYY